VLLEQLVYKDNKVIQVLQEQLDHKEQLDLLAQVLLAQLAQRVVRVLLDILEVQVLLGL
jgi:hypothetical protein